MHPTHSVERREAADRVGLTSQPRHAHARVTELESVEQRAIGT